MHEDDRERVPNLARRPTFDGQVLAGIHVAAREGDRFNADIALRPLGEIENRGRRQSRRLLLAGGQPLGRQREGDRCPQRTRVS